MEDFKRFVKNTLGRNGDDVFRTVVGKPAIPKHVLRNRHDDEIRMDELQGLRELDVVGWLSVGVLISRNNTNTHTHTHYPHTHRTTTSLSTRIYLIHTFIATTNHNS